MRILFASSEVYPFSKTGGLADVASFLPKEIQKLGHKITVVTPLYKQVNLDYNLTTYLGTSTISMGTLQKDINFLQYEHEGVSYIFVQNSEYFERDNFYGYDDDHLRFLLFSYAVLESVKYIKNAVNIIHVNDWQTALVPYLLDEYYRYNIEGFAHLHTLLTIHNLQYQGAFDKKHYHYLSKDLDYTYIHFDSINYLKTGIMRASKINTVSPSYRNETLSSWYGFSLDGALEKRQSDYVGILNGIDNQLLNSKTDPLLPYNFSQRNYLKGKKENKKVLFEKYNVNLDNLDKPLISYIGRLADQKGLDLLNNSIEEVVHNSNAIFFLMGSGQEKYEYTFRLLEQKNPGKILTYIGYNEELAQLVYAASDMFVMPSSFEPCGLGQMISMGYFTLPIVRQIGGLKDTVIPYNQQTKEGNGFVFTNYSSVALKETLFKAIDLYNNHYHDFKTLMKNAYNTKFDITTMANSYLKLYKTILKEK